MPAPCVAGARRRLADAGAPRELRRDEHADGISRRPARRRRLQWRRSPASVFRRRLMAAMWHPDVGRLWALWPLQRCGSRHDRRRRMARARDRRRMSLPGHGRRDRGRGVNMRRGAAPSCPDQRQALIMRWYRSVVPLVQVEKSGDCGSCRLLNRSLRMGTKILRCCPFRLRRARSPSGRVLRPPRPSP